MNIPFEVKSGKQNPQRTNQLVGHVLLDFDLAHQRLLSPRTIDAFEGSREGTRLYLADGTTVTATMHAPAAIAEALAPYFAEPLISVTLPGLAPHHYFVCGHALMGYTQSRFTGMSQGGIGPQVQLYVQLRSPAQFVIPQTSAREFEAVMEAAYGGPVRKVRIEKSREGFVAGGPAGFDAGEHRDLFLARAVARG